MNTTMNTNGRQRKSLASQIDRLDTMLDGLADNLNDAVAQAVKDAVVLAVQQAVSAVLSEALTNPAIMTKLHALTHSAMAEAPVAEPAPVAATPRLSQRLSSCRQWVGAWSRRAADAGQAALSGAKQKVARVGAACRPLWRFKAQIGLALGVGLMLGVAGFFAGPVLAAGASAVSGFIATLAVQAELWLQNMLRSPMHEAESTADSCA